MILVVTLGIGQRTDVLVTGLKNPSSAGYLMRSDITCSSTVDTQNPSVAAIVYYGSSVPSQTPATTAWPELTSSLAVCANVSTVTILATFETCSQDYE